MIEAAVNRLWYARRWAWLALILAPLAALFAVVSAARRTAFRRGWLRVERVGVPVVVVGNLTVGGSGKTPLVIHLAQTLARSGRRVGVVARGYGGRIDAAAMLPAQADPAIYGDEPVLIQRSAQVPVAVGRDRVAAVRLLLQAADVQVIVSDDGLQHYGLDRNLEIVVVDGAQGFGNGWRLPAGPLREPLGRLRNVNAIVVRDRMPGLALPLPDAGPPIIDMRVVATGVRRLAAESAALELLADWRGRRVHAVAAIGMPARFFASLRLAGLEVIEHAAPDHHQWQPRELEFGDALPVLMTAKDAVKCQGFARPHWYCVEAAAQFEPAAAARLLELVH